MQFRRVLPILCLFMLALPLPALASKSHVVRAKESLQSIARKYNVSTKELRQANNLSSNHVAKGTRLIIPSHVATSKPAVESCSTYRVRKGDTLQKVARKTGVSVAEIKRLNGIKHARLKPGSILTLAEQCDVNPTRQNRTGKLELVNQDLLTEQPSVQDVAAATRPSLICSAISIVSPQLPVILAQPSGLSTWLLAR